MAFPCLVYFASIGTPPGPSQADSHTLTNTADAALGIANICQDSAMRYHTLAPIDVSTSYYSICLSLNVLLTLMIVVRLILHIRNIRTAIGTSDGSSGLHIVITMLIESCALYAVSVLAYTVSWATNSSALYLFNGLGGTIQVCVVFTLPDALPLSLSNFDCTQVIAPYLIILRVAKRRAMTSESISGITESIRFRSQGSTDDDGSLPDGNPANWTDVYGGAAGEPVARDENVIGEVPL